MPRKPLFAGSFVDGVSHVAQADRGELDEMPKDGERMMAVCYLADGFFEDGQGVGRRLWRRLLAGLGRHRWPSLLLKVSRNVPPETLGW